MKYPKLSEEIHKKIAQDYQNEDITQLKLACKYGVSNVQISNILKKFKIPSVKRRGFYNVNISYFDKIDTPNKAYFLGLFHADGCNSEYNGCIRISLQEGDIDILNKLKEDINFSGPLRYIKKKGNRKNQYSLNIVSKDLSYSIKLLGYPENKTYKVIFPDYLSNDLIRHFIRGVFDGDGCIHVGKHHVFNIVGTFSTLIGIKSYLYEKLAVNSKISESKSKGIFRLNITKREDIFNVLTHLYNDSELFLNRKYKIYNDNYLINKSHLFWKILCRNIETGDVKIFENMQEMRKFFELKTYSSISYCINKSKNKIWRKKYYLNLLKNE